MLVISNFGRPYPVPYVKTYLDSKYAAVFWTALINATWRTCHQIWIFLINEKQNYKFS